MSYQQMSYSVDRYDTPRQQIDVNRPPVVFNIRCAPWIEQYLPYLTGVMIDFITREAKGPISIHFYNNMAKNNWNNDDFAREVHNCADFIFINARGSQDPNNIGQFAPAYIDLRTKFEVSIFTYLGQFVDPQDGRMFDQAIQGFQRAIQDINAVRNGNTAPPAQGGYQPPPPAAQAPYRAPAPAGYGGGYQAPPMGVQGGRNGGGGRDYGSANVSPPPAPRQASVPPPPQVQAQAQSAPTNSAPANQAVPEQLVEPDNVKWNPPVDRIHPLLYNPVLVKIKYTIVDGKTVQLPVQTNMDPINYDRHNISTIFGKVPENLPVVKDTAQIAMQIRDGAQEAVDESNQVDDEGERKYETSGLRNVLSAYNLDSAIMDVRTEMLSKIDRDDPPMVYQAYAQVFTPILADTSNYSFIKKLGESYSFIELREKLIAAGGKVEPALLTDISLKLTKLVNSILKDRLSILPADLEVTDFATDLEPLIEHLKTYYKGDDRVYKAFIKNQSERISAMFDAPDLNDENGKQLHDSLLSGVLTKGWDEREDPPSFVFYGPTVHLTFLNVISHDLLIQGMAEVGNIITKVHSKMLWDLADSLFKVNTNGMAVDRHLVVTKDGRVVEIFQGSLVEGTYLMSLVK